MSILKKFGFLGTYSFPVVMVLSYYLGGSAWTFLPVIYAYVFIPFVDELIGKDAHNIHKEAFQEVIDDVYFDILVYSHIWIQYGLIIWSGYILVFDDLSWWQQAGIILSQGIYASTIINVSHELGHRHSKIAKFHAKAGLISVMYFHFIIEHNRGHHVHVATPLDPATSKKNQSVYAFWKQSLVGGFKSAWNIEKKLLVKQHQPAWSVKNEMIWGTVAPFLLAALLFAAFSWITQKPQWIILILFFAQAIIAVLSLECVNYIEHYGIVRREVSAGRYERVNPLHSWNANHFYSNLLLFHLQRHSDHHAFASRPYQVLRHFDESPQLPFGYPVMILMSLVPPLFFRVMNHRLESWQTLSYDAGYIKTVVKQFA